jgi:hypothetical protein
MIGLIIVEDQVFISDPRENSSKNGWHKEHLGNPTDIHMNPKEGTLPQPTGFLEGSLSQLIGGQEQLGTSPKEVVDQI